MKTNTPSQLWAAICGGRALSAAEAAELTDAVSQDELLQADLLEDRGLHRTLSVLAAVDESRDDFVNEVLTRVDHQQLNTLRSGPSVPRRRIRDHRLLICVVCAFIAVALPFAFLLGTYVSTHGAANEQIVSLRIENVRLQDQLDALQTAIDATREQRHEQLNDRVERRESPPVVENASGQPAPPFPVMLPAVPDALSGWNAVDAEHAEWATEPGSVEDGRFELRAGSAELQTDAGSRIRIVGPTKGRLRSQQHVDLQQGALEAWVAADDVGFRVTTPNARVIDTGTEFEVHVDADGITDVSLMGGEVVVIPWQDGPGGERLHLADTGFRNARVSPAGDSATHLLWSQAEGPDAFVGRLSLGGKTMEFAQRPRFEQIRTRVSEELQDSVPDAVQDWLALSETFEAARGSVTVDGKTASLDSLERLMDFEDALMQRSGQMQDGTGQQTSTFSGSVMINGRRYNFNNREEYEQFRREMLDSLDQMGIFGPRRRQREMDEQVNPFLPEN